MNAKVNTLCFKSKTLTNNECILMIHICKTNIQTINLQYQYIHIF